jgi:hypothetical protein
LFSNNINLYMSMDVSCCVNYAYISCNPPSYQTGRNTRTWRNPSNKNQNWITLHSIPTGLQAP